MLDLLLLSSACSLLYRRALEEQHNMNNRLQHGKATLDADTVSSENSLLQKTSKIWHSCALALHTLRLSRDASTNRFLAWLALAAILVVLHYLVNTV